MKEIKINLNSEREIIVNLIMNKEFCTKILPFIQPKYFKSPYARSIYKWVKDYFEHYQEPPKEAIKDIFLQYKEGLTEEEINSITEFLVSLFTQDFEYDIKNTNFLIKTAEKYIKLRSLELLKNELEESIISGNPLKGEATVANYKRVGIPENNGVDILENKSSIIEAFTEENEPLFTFPGALRTVISPIMRGDLYAYIGKPKGQKTNALLYTAEIAALNGCKVVFFSLEMNKNQILRRSWQSFMGEPLVAGDYEIPYFSLVSTGKIPQYEVCSKLVYKEAIDLTKIDEKQQSMNTFFRGGSIYYVTMPRFSASIDDIIYYLDNLVYYNNFIPDVVIVDYADILKPSAYTERDEFRHRINDIWMRLAALAQTRNINVWTVTQTNRSGLSGDIELKDIAEEFRKIAHASMLIALNQNKEEKKRNVIRLKALIKRDEQVSDEDEAVVLQQLKLGRFYIDSKSVSEVIKIDENS